MHNTIASSDDVAADAGCIQRGGSAWLAFMESACPELEVVATSNETLTGAVLGATVGAVSLSRVRAGAQRFHRRKAFVKLGVGESFLLIFGLRGLTAYRQDRREGVLKSGDAILLNADRYYQCEFLEGTSNIAVKIPAHVLRARLPSIDHACAQDRAANTTLLPLVHRFMEDLLRLSGASAETERRLEPIFLDLIAALFDAGAGTPFGDCPPVLPKEFVRRQLASFIDQHLGKVGLDAQSAAAACRISERQVQRIFASVGTTFGRALLEARLRRADSMLCAPSSRHLSIGDIAYECGFATQSHFSDRYRSRYGRAPRDRRFV